MINYLINEELLNKIRNYILTAIPNVPGRETIDLFMRLGNLPAHKEENPVQVSEKE